jgi:phospholipid/cholesterol/gamma-HCH transport system permease protein
MPNAISQLGYTSLQKVQRLGSMAAFTTAVTAAAFRTPFKLEPFVRELHKLGVRSLGIIVVCGIAVGMVLGLQGYHTLQRFGASNAVGALVGLSLLRELGPIVTAILVIGRAGSATAAELGTMVATEQLDGLRMLSLDPIRLIVTPKALALTVVTPLLTAILILSGLYGGYLVGVGLMDGDPGLYISSLRSSVEFRHDIVGCFLKSLVFGLLIGLISTYRGYTALPNSEGVSAATTSTVVTGSVTVLLVDYVVSALWGV